MSIAMIRSIFTILLMSFVALAAAQSDSVVFMVDSVYTTDTLLVAQEITSLSISDFRIPSEEKIKEYQNDKRFQYETIKNKETQASGLDKLKHWILKRMGRIIQGVSQSGFLGIILILVIIVIIVFIILKIAGVNFQSVFGKQKLDTPEINIYSENVHEMDFDTLIKNALNNNDYRLAVRFMYLKNLKKLTDKRIIDWKINKTNYAYQHEIKDEELRDKFLDTSLIFDYVWYGEFPIDENNFSKAYSELDEFNKMIG